jgi:DNA-binding FadR family transcriptional regulator
MTDQIAPIERQVRDPVALEVTRRLLDYLLTGGIVPGSRLPPERKLAEAFGVGRTILREALKSLTLLGLVEVRQGDGNYLRSTETEFLPRAIEWGLLLGSKSTRDLIDARKILETAIVETAAERIDEAGLADLDAVMARMRMANEVGEFIAADVDFHRRIAEATANETLVKIMSNMQSLLKIWASRVMEAERDYGAIIAQHDAILDAMRRRDPGAAARAMKLHLSDVSKRLERTLGSPAESARQAS